MLAQTHPMQTYKKHMARFGTIHRDSLVTLLCCVGILGFVYQVTAFDAVGHVFRLTKAPKSLSLPANAFHHSFLDVIQGKKKTYNSINKQQALVSMCTTGDSINELLFLFQSASIYWFWYSRQSTSQGTVRRERNRWFLSSWSLQSKDKRHSLIAA